MRIGLLRHFRVSYDLPRGWRTVGELHTWRERYDTLSPSVGEFELGGVSWTTCLSSDHPRAATTARCIFQGRIEYTALLREARFATFQTGGLRLPVWVWQALLRLAWMAGAKSQRACRDEFRQRVIAVADRLEAFEQDTLVVSHAGVMAYLSSELLRRGFCGPRLKIAHHATAYIYERANRGFKGLPVVADQTRQPTPGGHLGCNRAPLARRGCALRSLSE